MNFICMLFLSYVYDLISIIYIYAYFQIKMLQYQRTMCESQACMNLNMALLFSPDLFSVKVRNKINSVS